MLHNALFTKVRKIVSLVVIVLHLNILYEMQQKDVWSTQSKKKLLNQLSPSNQLFFIFDSIRDFWTQAFKVPSGHVTAVPSPKAYSSSCFLIIHIKFSFYAFAKRFL